MQTALASFVSLMKKRSCMQLNLAKEQQDYMELVTAQMCPKLMCWIGEDPCPTCAALSQKDTMHAELPTNPEGYSETISEYADRLREVAVKLLEVMSESLGLPSSFLEEVCGGARATQLLMTNFGPSCPNPPRCLWVPLTVIQTLAQSHCSYKTKWVACKSERMDAGSKLAQSQLLKFL